MLRVLRCHVAFWCSEWFGANREAAEWNGDEDKCRRRREIVALLFHTFWCNSRLLSGGSIAAFPTLVVDVLLRFDSCIHRGGAIKNWVVPRVLLCS
jgi:hypothetical protein